MPSMRISGDGISKAGEGRQRTSAPSRSTAGAIEPLEPISYAVSAQVAFQAREYPAAVEFARRAVLTDSEFWIGYVELGQAYERTGETDLALEALTDAARFSGGNSKVVSLKG